MIKAITAGKLTLELTHGQGRFEDLIALASRENHKRGFLFVSKVLGKHIPVRPRAMRRIYDELALLCQKASHTAASSTSNGTFVIGMAETATGLGAGLADSLARNLAAQASTHHQQKPSRQGLSAPSDTPHGGSVYYQHTTRHHLPNHPIWFSLKESHSHAVDHIIYEPNQQVIDGIKACDQLILVDDEATTGKTLLQLAQHTLKRLPNIRQVQIVTLANWLTPERKAAFLALPVPVSFIQLIAGTFDFQADPSHFVHTPSTVDKDICRLTSREDLGRTGLRMPYTLSTAQIQKLKSAHPEPELVIVGTGEHLYYPFLMAEALAEDKDVLFQSTTRSPILMGNAISRKTRFFVDALKEKENYIYNLPFDRKPIILCEHEAHAQLHGLHNGHYTDENITDTAAQAL